MVAKIQPAHEETDRALEYNRKKMSGPEGILTGDELARYEKDPSQTGHMLAERNVPELSCIENEFARLLFLSRRHNKARNIEKPVFHMSINPGEGDRKLTEKQIVELADEIMQGLGYGDSPYVIYKHNDIAREHYHIVSTRISQDGSKINDSFENKRCNEILKKLAPKYGYVVGVGKATDLDKEMGYEKTGSDEESEEQNFYPSETNGFFMESKETRNPRKQPKRDDSEGHKGQDGQRQGKPSEGSQNEPEKPKKTIVPPFDKKSEIPRVEQYRNIHEDAMKWSFTTPEQYAALLARRYNTQALIYDDGVWFVGYNESLQAGTMPVNEKDVGVSALKDVMEKCELCAGTGKESMKKKKSQRERIEKLTKWAADSSTSWKDFIKVMERKGVYVVVSWTKDNEPFGITYLDRATKCAWKGSELDTDLNWLKLTGEEKGWEIERHPKYERAERESFRRDMPGNKMKTATSRRRINHQVKDSSSPTTMQRLNHMSGVGQTRRSNVDASKNHDRLGKDDKNEIII